MNGAHPSWHRRVESLQSFLGVCCPRALKIERTKPSLVVGRSLVLALLMSSHRFSIGLASGDCAGHCTLLTPVSSYHWSILAALCAGALSSWKTNGCCALPKMLAMDGNKWASRISRYLALSMFPSTQI